MRYVCQATAIAVLTLLAASEARGQQPPELSVTNYQLVSEQRWSRTHSYMTYRAELVNTGLARNAVIATVSSLVPTIEVVPGQANLRFSPVPAGGRVPSSNTFSILVDRSVPFDFKSLRWSFLSPLANAGANQTVKVGDTVVLNGTGSTNPSGVGALSYRWAFESRPGSAARIFNSDQAIASFVVDVAGEYIVSLTVSNGFGTDTAFVRISTGNSPPVANAGPSQTVSAGANVVLNGSGSSDVDGDPLSHNWAFVSRPSGSAAVLSNPNTVSPSFVADVMGSYVVRLVVNDGKVNSAPATVTINTVNTAPVANAGPNQAVSVGAVVQLNGSASTDVDGDQLTYRWMFNSVPPNSKAALSNALIVNPTFTADVAGSYVVQLIVNDGNKDSAPATVTITTNAVQSPTAVAGPNQTVKRGDTVLLNGSGTDPQGRPLTYHWSMTSKPGGSAAVLSSTTVPRPTFVADAPGAYILQLIVNNGFVNSAPSTLTVTTTNTPPVANAGANRTVQVGATVTLSGTGSSDADGDTLTYAWSLINRPQDSAAALTGATTSTPSFVADKAGTYVAQLIVNDGFANSTPATVTITAGVNSIVLSPTPLNLPRASTGVLTVTLGSPAGPGGVDVRLTSSDPSVASVPQQLIIPQGQSSGTVTVNTGVVGTALILATANNFTNASVTANVTVPALAVALDSSTIGINGSTSGTVTLSVPAPAGGINIGLSTVPSGIVTVPASINIPAGGTTGTFQITAAAVGITTITASHASFNSGSAVIGVSNLGAIKLTPNVSVGPGQSAPLGVSLLTAAPVGGVTVQLTSSAPGVATVTPSVFIPQGAVVPTTPAQVTGVSFGTANITASATGYQGDTQAVNVQATLTFQPNTLTLATGATQNLTLNLSAPAPAGLVITLSSDSPGFATVPATLPFPAGATTLSVPITGVAAGTTTIRARSLPNLAETTASVTVASVGTINLPANISLAVGQSAAFPIALSAPAPAGGVVVNLTSSDPSKLTISPASVTIATGNNTPTVQPQVTGVGTGTVTITATASGYGSKTASVSVTGGLSFSPSSITVAPSQTQAISVVLPAPSPNPVTVTLTSDSAAVATVPASVVIPANTTSANFNVTGVALGSTTIRANATGYSAATASVTVQNAGTIQVPASVSVPLKGTTPFAVSLPAPAAANVTINLVSSDPSKVTIAPASVTVLAGQTTPATQPQVTGVSVGSANITASASGYVAATRAVSVTASLTFNPSTVSVAKGGTRSVTVNLSAATPVAMTINLTSDSTSVATITGSVTIAAGASSATATITGVNNGTTVVRASGPAGVSPATANVTVSSGLIVPAEISVKPGEQVILPISLATAPTEPVSLQVTSADPSKATVQQNVVTIQPGQTQPAAPVRINGIALGTTTISVAGIGYPTATTTVRVNAALSFNQAALTMGPTATQNVGITLSSPAPAGGLVVNLTSSAPAVATVPASVTINAGQTTASVQVKAVGLGTTTINASTAVPNVTGATLPVNVIANATIILPATFNVGMGQFITYPISLSAPAGPGGVTVTLTSDSTRLTFFELECIGTPCPPVPQSALTRTVFIPTGMTVPQTQPQVRGVTPGPVNITATAPGITPVTRPAQVTATFSFTPQDQTLNPGATGTLFLGFSGAAPPPPVGLTVTLKSSNPGVATVPNTSTAFWDGSSPTTLLIPVHAIAPGTTTITASAPNMTDVTATVTVAGPLTITSASPLPTAVQGAAYTVTIAVGGGKAPYTFSATNLPPGLTINASTGVISGTATASGNRNVVVTVTDSTTPTPRTATKTLALNVSAALTITTATLPNGTVGAAYSGTLAASNGTAPLTWSATGLPAGLSINASTGAITGTPTAAGSNNVAVTVKDSANPQQTATKSFTVNIAAGLSISTTALASGVVNTAYSATVAAAGGTAPYTWSATGLPAGLSIAPATGVISGTPTAAGTSNVSVTATDSTSPTKLTATKSFSLVIGSNIAITTATLPGGIVGASYTAALAATGGATPYTWSATGLPAGLAINASTGAITGTPTTAGTSNITVTARDSSTPALVATKNFSVVIGPSLALTTTSLPNGTVGAAYTATLAATGGTTPYTWSATSLPAGLSINPTTGVISGTPTAATTNNVVVTVTDSTAPTKLTRTATLSLRIVGALSITTTSLPPGTVGAAYSTSVAATGGSAPYTWSATGLPAGLSINAANGAITGTPTTAGNSTVTITVSDANNPKLTATATLTLSIASPISITTASPLPQGTAGVQYSTPLAVTGGIAPYTWSATGLPAGLALNPSTGVLSGIPSASGTSTIAVTVRDSSAPTARTATKNLTLVIAPSLTISTTTLPSAVVGQAYSGAVAGAGGTTPYTWSATGLPAGLSINASTGAITGTPTAAGNSTVAITLTDSTSPTKATATKSLQLIVAPALTITTASPLPNGVVGLALSRAIAATGGTAPYTWSATGLPAGLTINPTTGVIGGTPTASGTSSIAVTVQDSTTPKATATKTFALTIAPALTITTASPLPPATRNAAYNAPLAATGGNAPLTWSATGLPAGLSINASTGVISGTPTAVGTSTISVTVSDATAPTKATATKSFSLTVGAPAPASIVPITNSDPAVVLTEFSSQLQAVVRDASNTPVSGVPVVFTAPANGPSLRFASTNSNTATVNTNAAGIATAPVMTANALAGSYDVTATVGALAPARFGLSNLPDPGSGQITVGTANVGLGLQTSVPVSISSPAPAGGVTVTLTTSDATRAALGPTATATATATIPEGQNAIAILVSGMTNVGSAVLTGTAQGYATGTGSANVTRSGFVLAGPNDVGTSFTLPVNETTNLTVFSARLDSNNRYVEKQALRASFTGTVTVQLTSTSAGSVTPTSVTFSPGDSNRPASFKALATGAATITAATPTGFTAVSDNSNVLVATILPGGLIMPTGLTVGRNLQISTSIGLNGVAPSSGMTVTLTSADATKLRFAASPTAAGTGTLTLTLPPDARGTPEFWIQGFDSTGSVNFTAQAAGFGSGTSTVNLAPSGIVFTNVFGGPPNPILAGVGGASVPVTVYSARLNNGAWAETQALAGGLSATVTISSSNPAAGGVNPTSVTINGGSTQATTSFQPGTAGSTNLTVSVPAAPAGFATPAPAYRTLVANVTNSTLVLSANGVSIGKDLQIEGAVILSQAAPAGGLQVTLSSGNAAALRLAAAPTEAGAASIVVTVPAGANSANFYLQSLVANGSATYSATAAGYGAGTATVNLTPSGVVLSNNFGFGLPITIPNGSDTGEMRVNMAQLQPGTNAFVAIQQLRGGLTLSNVVITPANSNVATVDSPVNIVGGADPTVSNAVVRRQSTGSTTLAVTQPAGFVTPAAGPSPIDPKPTIGVNVQ